MEQTEEATASGEHDLVNPLYTETTQDSQLKEEETQQDSLTQEESSSFPYTLGHNEEASYKADLGEKGDDEIADETEHGETVDDAVDITTGEESKAELEDVTQSGYLVEDASNHQGSAAHSGVKNTEYADIVISTPSQAPDLTASVPIEHDYASPEAVTATAESTGQQPPAVYTNTSPGVVTQEALSHYDFGQ